MRQILAPVLAAIGLVAAAAPAMAQAPTKIGYIDTRRVIQEAPGAQEAQSTMEREFQALQQRMQAMDDSLRTIVQEYQQRSLMMSADAKQKREQEILEKQTEFRQRAEQMEQQAARRQQELLEPIMQRVEQVISDVRQAEGYIMIFDVSSDAIVSADPAFDLTAKVIERMRAAAPAAAR